MPAFLLAVGLGLGLGGEALAQEVEPVEPEQAQGAAEPPPLPQPSEPKSKSQPQPQVQPQPQPQVQPPPIKKGDSAAAARELLRQAIDLYVVGRYSEAARRLRPLVEERVLADEADQKEALRAFGISLFLSGAQAGAEQAFRGLLRLDQEERMDPHFVRPEVVAFFEDLRRRYRAELAGEVRKRSPRYTVANLLPPWGQFQNRHRIKGYLVLSGELVLAAGSITTAALLYSWRDKQGRFPGHEDDYSAVSATNYACFAALAALVIYGVVDGLYYYYRDRPAQDGLEMDGSAAAAQEPALFRF